MAHSPEAVRIVCDVINERDRAASRLGDPALGLDVPDLVVAGYEWAATVTGVDGPNDASCTVTDEDGRAVDRPPLHRRAGVWQAAVSLPRPGVFRVAVARGNRPATSQWVMACIG